MNAVFCVAVAYWGIWALVCTFLLGVLFGMWLRRRYVIWKYTKKLDEVCKKLPDGD